MNTSNQYDEAIESAKEIFLKKTLDYGTSWRVLRPISVADQIYIKARRIRIIQENGMQKIADNINDEFRGIINYAVIGLIQLQITDEEVEDLEFSTCRQLYEKYIQQAKALMEMKNHDYGEAWREMSQESFADLILMKIHRMRQIIRNQGQTLISEGLDANYMDILNYAVFSLILYP